MTCVSFRVNSSASVEANNPSVTCGDSSREKREPFMSRNIEHPMRRIHQRAIKRAWLTNQREKYERTIRVNAVYL